MRQAQPQWAIAHPVASMSNSAPPIEWGPSTTAAASCILLSQHCRQPDRHDFAFSIINTATEGCTPIHVEVPARDGLGYELHWAPDGAHLIGRNFGDVLTVDLYNACGGALIDRLSLPRCSHTSNQTLWMAPSDEGHSQGIRFGVWTDRCPTPSLRILQITPAGSSSGTRANDRHGACSRLSHQDVALHLGIGQVPSCQTHTDPLQWSFDRACYLLQQWLLLSKPPRRLWHITIISAADWGIVWERTFSRCPMPCGTPLHPSWPSAFHLHGPRQMTAPQAVEPRPCGFLMIQWVALNGLGC